MAKETGRRGVLGGESAAGFDTAMVRPLSLLSCSAASLRWRASTRPTNRARVATVRVTAGTFREKMRPLPGVPSKRRC